jgi:hypothetical protein
VALIVEVYLDPYVTEIAPLQQMGQKLQLATQRLQDVTVAVNILEELQEILVMYIKIVQTPRWRLELT